VHSLHCSSATRKAIAHNEGLMRINTFDKVTSPLLDGVGALRFQLLNDTFGAELYQFDGGGIRRA
jgi:hypothetical protein